MDAKLQSKTETYEHILIVQHYLNIIIKELIDRGNKHDKSKLIDPELSGFAENINKLEKVEYGTQEYNNLLKELKPTIEHHYANNSHHPEFYQNGIEDFDLIDLIEMFCDWKAATKRNKNGNINTSIDKNAERFNINSQLVKIFKNTVRKLNE